MPHRRCSPAVIVARVHVNGYNMARSTARKGAYVVAVDSDPNAAGFHSRYVKERIVLPPVSDDPSATIEWLLSRRDLYGALVVPTDDFYVRCFHAAYDKLSPCYKLAVSPGRSTTIALNKGEAYKAAAELGFAVPKTVYVESEEDLDAADEIGFPLILRAEFSLAFVQEFHSKNFEVSDREELVEAFRKARSSGHKMMMQEIIPGDTTNIITAKGYVTDAGVFYSLANVKLCQYPPFYGIGQIWESCEAPEVVDISERLLRHIGYRGAIFSVEWKVDERDGNYKLIEINCRSVMSGLLGERSGVDMPGLLLHDKLGMPLPDNRAYKHDHRLVYIKNGLLRYRKYPEWRTTFREYMRWHRSPMSFALLNLADLKPWLYDIAPIFARRFRRKQGG